VETPLPFPAHERYAVETLLPPAFPHAPLPTGRPVPHTPFPISEPYVYPEAITTAWPGKFHGLPSFPVKQWLPLNHYGH
jgi:hypothetical protein